jgi:glycosyltransferase involved in cell wall biosynthesis
MYWYLPLKFLLPFKPVYLTFHGWEGIFPIPKKIICIRKIAEHLTNGNICAGEFICKWYRTKSNFVTYGGIRQESEGNYLDNDPSGGAVFVGRLGKDTGLDIYLKALGILKKRGIELSLTVCGDGPLMVEYQALARSYNLMVDFRGWISDPTPHIRKARFVFVSGYLAILQAMAMGKLVFSVFDNPLKEDYLRLMPNNENMMFIANGPDELANQLQLCLAKPSVADVKINIAREWAMLQSWDKVADIYEQLWNQ